MAQLVFMLGMTVIVVALFKYFRLPSIIAYLLIGCLMGPFALGELNHSEQMQQLADIGIVFLLFTIGLELPLEKFIAMRYNMLLIGGGQVLLCTALIAGVCYLFTKSLILSWVMASALALSSTAIVMRQLSEQNELFSEHGQLAFAMLIFQDIAVVPLLIILPLLKQYFADGFDVDFSIVWPIFVILIKGIIIFFTILILSKTVFRRIFHKIAQTRSLELFMFMVLFVALLAAFVTDEFGLSMTFGAFVAGIGLGESEFRHQIDAEVRPFKDILLGIFFISIGMMLDIHVVIENFGSILAVVLTMVLIKFIVVSFLCYRLGKRVNLLTAIQTGMIMAHAGEFSLALLTLAKNDGIIKGHVAQIVLAASILSLFVAVLLTKNAKYIISFLSKNKFFAEKYNSTQRPDQLPDNAKNNHYDLTEHVIICGYGRVGKILAKFLKNNNHPYLCLELDPVLVTEGVMDEFNVYYGNATSRDVLLSVNLNQAKLVAICIDNEEITKKIINNIRLLENKVKVLVRTRDLNNRNQLLDLGANEVIAETFEAGMMLALNMFLMLGIAPEAAMEYIKLYNDDMDNFYQRICTMQEPDE